MESNSQDLLSQQMLEIDTEFDKFCSQITDNQLSEIIIDSIYQGATSSRFQLLPNSGIYASPKSDEDVTLLQNRVFLRIQQKQLHGVLVCGKTGD